MAVSQHSLKSVHITPMLSLYDKDGEPSGDLERLASATGFVILHNEKNYLVTNWHVAAGRDPHTGQALAKHGGTPTKIEVWFVHIGNPYQISWTPWTFDLVDREGYPLWLEHPVHRRKVDVVALPVDIPDNLTPLPYLLDPPSDHRP